MPGLEEHPQLLPNIIKDQTTGPAGIVAGELAAEEHLISDQQEASQSYGTIELNQEECADYNGYALPPTQLRVVVLLLFLCSFLAALDTTVVTALLTKIANDLNAISLISWIATAYLLSCSAMQPIFGKLSDIFGRRAMLFICCITFGLGCAMCVTKSLTMLVLGRFVTGLGGLGMTCLGTITMSDLIPLRDRGFYQGMANIFFGLGSASGGFVGGLISDALGWEYVFILQVPLALLAAFVIRKYLILPSGSPGLGAVGSSMRAKLARVDFLGSFLLVLALMCVLTAASIGGKDVAYSSPWFIGLCIASFVLLAAFVYVEAYISEEPIIPIHLLGERTIISLSLANWFYSMGVFTYLFYIPVFFSTVMQLSATQTGLRLIPNFFAVSVGSVGAGIYMKKTGRYWKLAMVFGLISVIGIIRLYWINPQASLLTQFTIMLPPGFGYSVMLTITLLALILAAPAKYQACTTSIQYTFRSTGSTLGVSIALALFQYGLRKNLLWRVPAVVLDPELAKKFIEKALANSDYIYKAPKYVSQAISDSYWMACRLAFAFAVATITMGAISAIFMRENKLHLTVNRD
ncbi:MFS transporter [Kocuria palustris]|nr:MFS transporter [Kocuria palustris]